VSKKFFSLIYGDELHVAPKTKVIKSDKLSKLLESKELVERVQNEAKKYRQETVNECEKLKDTAQKEGFEEGFKEWADQVAFLEKEVTKVQKELEKKIVPVAIKAAQKILGRELELSDKTVVDIVSTTLKAIASHKKVVLYVNRKDLDILESEKKQLKAIFENIQSLSIRPSDDMQPGSCIVESEVGIINAQLDQKWKVLEKAFKGLFTKEKG